MILASRKPIYRSSFLDVFGVWLPFLPSVPMSDWGGLHAGSGSLHSGGAEVLPLRDAVHPQPVPVQDPRRVQRSASLQRLPAGRLWQPQGHLLLKGQRSWCTSPQLMSLWVMIFSKKKKKTICCNYVVVYGGWDKNKLKFSFFFFLKIVLYDMVLLIIITKIMIET